MSALLHSAAESDETQVELRSHMLKAAVIR